MITVTDRLAPDAFKSILERAEAIGFWDLPEHIVGSSLCGSQATHASAAVITVYSAEVLKSVTNYHGCLSSPRRLRQLEAYIDTVAGTNRWVRPGRRF